MLKLSLSAGYEMYKEKLEAFPFKFVPVLGFTFKLKNAQR